MPEQAIVELSNVGKMYAGAVAAIAGVDLAIRPGEFVSLVGPSGCGKSTILRIIAGLADSTSGAVKRSWDVHRRRSQPLSCVFQEPTLLPWARVWDNVYLPLRLQSASRKSVRSRVDQALQLVGLLDAAKLYPRQLSGGMKMRAAVARALVSNPQLLLLDEPFAALDEITRTRLNDDLRAAVRSQSCAALFITHSVFEAVYLSTRVIVMSPRPGRIVDQVAIDLPAERSFDTRTTPRYMELCRQVSHSLERSMAASTVGTSRA